MEIKRFVSGCIVFISFFIFEISAAQKVLPMRGLCAHRGIMDNYPENTIPSFLEAIYVGAQMIEFDVNVTKDGVPVVIHDEKVDRTTNGTGFIKDYTLAELKQLDAGIKKAVRFKGIRVPTLEEVLDIMPRNVWLNCHIKGGVPAAVKTTQMLLERGRLYQSFLACNDEEAKSAKKITDLVMICNMTGQRGGFTYVESSVQKKADFVQFWPNSPDSLNKQIIDVVRATGIKANYFQPQDYRPQDIYKLFSEGIDFILVGDAERFMPEAERIGIKPVRPEF